MLSDDEFTRRVKPRSADHMEAEASFKLAVWLTRAGNTERARAFYKRAQQLNPDDWNYHRQDWSFTPEEAGKLWLEKFQKLDSPYIRSWKSNRPATSRLKKRPSSAQRIGAHPRPRSAASGGTRDARAAPMSASTC